MRRKILIAMGILAGITLVFVGIVALQPAAFRIERSTQIAVPPDVIFAQVNDLHQWENWSPWAKLDPAAKNTFEGPDAGQGAIFKWSGNDKVGEGQMTITESHPSELIVIQLEFKRPFEDTNRTEFTFKSAGDQTTVTWAMSGKHTFVSKAVCMFMNLDKMLGTEFEKGLKQLRQISEERATLNQPVDLSH